MRPRRLGAIGHALVGECESTRWSAGSRFEFSGHVAVRAIRPSSEDAWRAEGCCAFSNRSAATGVCHASVVGVRQALLYRRGLGRDEANHPATTAGSGSGSVAQCDRSTVWQDGRVQRTDLCTTRKGAVALRDVLARLLAKGMSPLYLRQA